MKFTCRLKCRDIDSNLSLPITLYLIDSFTYAASVTSATNVFRKYVLPISPATSHRLSNLIAAFWDSSSHCSERKCTTLWELEEETLCWLVSPSSLAFHSPSGFGTRARRSGQGIPSTDNVGLGPVFDYVLYVLEHVGRSFYLADVQVAYHTPSPYTQCPLTNSQCQSVKHITSFAFLVRRSVQHRRDQIQHLAAELPLARGRQFGDCPIGKRARSAGWRCSVCLDVDRLKGHCTCGWPHVKAVSQQRVLLICKGQWSTQPFERARPEGWSWSDYRCVRSFPDFLLSRLTRWPQSRTTSQREALDPYSDP